MYVFRYKTEAVNKIRLSVRRMMNEIMVVFSVPGIGSLSRMTYPRIAKKKTVIEAAKAKIAEVILNILVDL